MEKPITIQVAQAQDASLFVQLRSQTRENAISESRLASLGVTAASWKADILSGDLVGFTAKAHERIVGYCFGNTRTGEIVVLAVLPELEGRGFGRKLLSAVVALLHAIGHRRLFLGSSPNAKLRSYGFYRHLGWRPTGATDRLQDEVLELTLEDTVSNLAAESP